MNIVTIILALTVLIPVYFGLNYYLYHKVRLAFSCPGRYLVITVALLAASFIVAQLIVHAGYAGYAKPLAWAGSLWLGFIFLFFALHISVDLIGHFIGQRFAAVTPHHITMVVSLLVILICATGIKTAREINIVPVTISTDKITTALTIVQISDLHLGIMSHRPQIQQIVERINSLQPDIIVSTGDLVDMQLYHLDEFEQDLAQLKAPLGKFAVSGNHEAIAGIRQSAEFIRRAGFQLLAHAGVTVGDLNIVGVDDPAAVDSSIDSGIDERRLLQAYTTGFTLLLKHQPRLDAVDEFDLQLSGHTHGGQIFPFGLLTAIVYPHPSGLSKIGERSWLYISRGAGVWGPPMRVGAAPEITLIRLVPE